jgi:hypothetical protein
MEIAKTQKKIADIFWGGVSHVHTAEREGARECERASECVSKKWKKEWVSENEASL